MAKPQALLCLMIAMVVSSNSLEELKKKLDATSKAHAEEISQLTSFVMERVLENEVHLETSSAFDINIVKKMKDAGRLKDEQAIRTRRDGEPSRCKRRQQTCPGLRLNHQQQQYQPGSRSFPK